MKFILLALTALLTVSHLPACGGATPATTRTVYVGGAQQLHAIHPEFRARVERFLTRAADAGHDLKIISGFRPLDRSRARRGRASWHNFGLALDFNFRRYRSMNHALKNYRRDRRTWQSLGRIAESEGLIWGGRWNRKEIFHVEWHPGMPSGLRGKHLRRMLAGNGPRNLYYARSPTSRRGLVALRR